MKNLMDYTLFEMGLDHSVSMFQMCRELPDNEIHNLISLLKKTSVNLVVCLNHYVYSSDVQDRIYFLDNALGYMRKVMTVLELLNRMKIINDEEMAEKSQPLNNIIDNSCDKMSRLKEKLDQEDLLYSVGTLNFTNSVGKAGKGKYES